jgi:hypothetical protein
MNSKNESLAVPAGYVRVPGFFRRAELDPIDKLGAGLHVVDAGADPEGEALVAVFQRKHGARRRSKSMSDAVPVSVEVTLPDAIDGLPKLTVRYCDTCHRWGRRRSVHICGVNWQLRLGRLLHELSAEAISPDEGKTP